jgi:hypothetical protein
MPTEEPLVTVATFGVVGEAEAARLMLEAEGIECFLADAETVNMLWFASNAIGGVKLQVPASEATRAEQLLARHQPARKRNVDDYGLERPRRGTAPSAATTGGGEESDAVALTADALVSRAWRASILGLVLCPPLLHIYSLWLLAQAMSQEKPVSAEYHGRWLASLVIDMAAIIGMASLWPMWNLLMR